MTQKKPKQTPEGIRAELKSLGITPADSDRIFRFVNSLSSTSPEMPSVEDSQSAASFIFELIVAAQQGKEREIPKIVRKHLGIRKIIEKKFDSKLVNIGDPEFELVMQIVRDKRKTEDVADDLADLHNKDPRTTKKWIKAIKPRVIHHLEQMEKLKKMK